jgi:hypothetical protein
MDFSSNDQSHDGTTQQVRPAGSVVPRAAFEAGALAVSLQTLARFPEIGEPILFALAQANNAMELANALVGYRALEIKGTALRRRWDAESAKAANRLVTQYQQAHAGRSWSEIKYGLQYVCSYERVFLNLNVEVPGWARDLANVNYYVKRIVRYSLVELRLTGTLPFPSPNQENSPFIFLCSLPNNDPENEGKIVPHFNFTVLSEPIMVVGRAVEPSILAILVCSILGAVWLIWSMVAMLVMACYETYRYWGAPKPVELQEDPEGAQLPDELMGGDPEVESRVGALERRVATLVRKLNTVKDRLFVQTDCKASMDVEEVITCHTMPATMDLEYIAVYTVPPKQKEEMWDTPKFRTGYPVVITEEIAITGSMPIPVEPLPSCACIAFADILTGKGGVIGQCNLVKIETREGMKQYLLTAVHVLTAFGVTSKGYSVIKRIEGKWISVPLDECKIKWTSLRGDTCLIEAPLQISALKLAPATVGKPKMPLATYLYAWYDQAAREVRGIKYPALQGWYRTVGKISKAPAHVNGLYFTGTAFEGASGGGYFQVSAGKHYIIAMHQGGIEKTDINIGRAISQFSGPPPVAPAIKEEISTPDISFQSDIEDAFVTAPELYDRGGWSDEDSFDTRNNRFEIGHDEESEDDDDYLERKLAAAERKERMGRVDLGAERGIGQFDSISEEMNAHPTRDFHLASKAVEVQPFTPPPLQPLTTVAAVQGSESTSISNSQADQRSVKTELGSLQSVPSKESGPEHLLLETAKLRALCADLQRQLDLHQADLTKRQVREAMVSQEAKDAMEAYKLIKESKAEADANHKAALAAKAEQLEKQRETMSLAAEALREAKEERKKQNEATVKLQQELKATKKRVSKAGTNNAPKKPPTAGQKAAAAAKALDASLAQSPPPSPASTGPPEEPKMNG